MASRIMNRRELRKQADDADQAERDDNTVESAPLAKKRKAKGGTASKARKSRPKKPAPRMRARWGVFDGSMKQIAIFDYNDRPSADAKLADLREKKKGVYFVQIVKEPMPEPAAATALTD
jgi:hypothetical protein